MPWPNFPTDNLYKFMAIFGFVTAVLSFAVYGYVLASYNFGAAERDVSSKHIEQLHEIRQQNSDFIEKTEKSRFDLLYKLFEAGKKGERLSASEWEARIEALIRESSATSAAAAQRNFEDFEKRWVEVLPIMVAIARHGVMLDLLGEYSPALNWAGAAGIALSILGFALWYFKVQRFQDAALERDARVAAKQLRATSASRRRVQARKTASNAGERPARRRTP